MIYILQHTVTGEIMAVFNDKEYAEQWQSVVNYSRLTEHEIKQPETSENSEPDYDAPSIYEQRDRMIEYKKLK